jgi:hypothetical protein
MHGSGYGLVEEHPVLLTIAVVTLLIVVVLLMRCR